MAMTADAGDDRRQCRTTPERWIETAEAHAAEAGSTEPAAIAVRGHCPGFTRAPPVNLPPLQRTQRDRREEREPIA